MGYQRLSDLDVKTLGTPGRAFAEEVLLGLSERPRRLPSRYIYDDRGSDLFAQITSLEAYYPTRLEAGILAENAGALLDRFDGAPLNLVDLGAGDGHKTRILLRHLADKGADVRYVPIDISEGAMQTAVNAMAEALPQIEVSGLVGDYFEALRWLSGQTERRNLVLFLGSNIGNFRKAQARAFLRRLWSNLNPDDRVLIGFDLKKDIEKLLLAYNDPEGVTADFNLNLLRRINNELGGHFDLSAFRHFSTYDVFSGAMESYLVSLTEQTVTIDALATDFRFDAWEPIHTEYSYKYLSRDIDDLAAFTRFSVEARWHDSEKWFCDALWRVQR